MSQSQLVVDFPIKAPANAKAVAEELPPLMPDFASVQDDLGTVHFSRFMVEGDQKLLFLSDIDGETDQHIERLVESAGPVFDAIFRHVDDPPGTPVAGNPEKVSKWLKHHVHKPLDTLFAYEDASVSGHQGLRACRPLRRQHLAEPPADLHVHQVAWARPRLEIDEGPGGEEGPRSDGKCWDGAFPGVACPLRTNHLGFFTIFDGDFAKYAQDFADKTSFVFDAVFHHVDGAPPTPVAKNPQAFYQWALEANHPPIGFYSAYPGLSVQDIHALLADRG